MKVTYGWKRVEDLYTSTCPNNVNKVEKRVHQLLFEDEMSIWIRNGAGGVKMDKLNKLIMFTLSIIYGPRGDLRFAAQHPRTLSSAKPEEESEEESEDDFPSKRPRKL